MSRLGRDPDHIAAVAKLGLRFVEYVDEDASGANRRTRVRSIPHLRVRLVGSSTRPSFHTSSGLYGFVNPKVRASDRLRVHIWDPRRRYLPRAWESAGDLRANEWRRDLEDGRTPDWSSEPFPVADVPLYPAVEYPAPATETVLFGMVHSEGRAVPYARIEISSAEREVSGAPNVATRVVTYTDHQGAYFARFPREARREHLQPNTSTLQVEFERNITVSILKNAVPEDSPLLGFPADFENQTTPWRNVTPTDPANGKVTVGVGEHRKRNIELPTLTHQP